MAPKTAVVEKVVTRGPDGERIIYLLDPRESDGWLIGKSCDAQGNLTVDGHYDPMIGAEPVLEVYFEEGGWYWMLGGDGWEGDEYSGEAPDEATARRDGEAALAKAKAQLAAAMAANPEEFEVQTLNNEHMIHPGAIVRREVVARITAAEADTLFLSVTFYRGDSEEEEDEDDDGSEAFLEDTAVEVEELIAGLGTLEDYYVSDVSGHGERIHTEYVIKTTDKEALKTKLRGAGYNETHGSGMSFHDEGTGPL